MQRFNSLKLRTKFLLTSAMVLSGTVSGANNQIMSTDTNGIVIPLLTDTAGCIQTYSVDVNNLEIGYASFDVASFGFTTFWLSIQY
jgi:hypothetical protein